MKRFSKLFLGIAVSMVFFTHTTPVWAASSFARNPQGFSAIAGEAVTLGNSVCYSGETIFKADADDADRRPAVGFVERTVGAGTLTGVVVRGVLNGQVGLTPGGAAFLSATAAGVTQTPVAAYPQVLGFAASPTSYQIDISPFSAAGGAITGTTGDFSGAVGIDGNFDVNTNKFTVTAASGNTAVAGTFDVTGAATFASAPAIDTGIFSVSTISRLPADQWEYVNEFNGNSDLDATNDWVVTTTEAGAGSATETVQDALFGIMKFTNAAGDDDLDSIQSKFEIAALTASKQTIFQIRFQLNEATENDVILGLCSRDTTPLDASDCVAFVKDDDDTNWDFITVASSSETEVAAVDTADTSFHVFSIVCTGTTSCTPYIDGVAGTPSTTNLPSAEMTVTLHLQNGEAVAKTLDVDYIYLMQER